MRRPIAIVLLAALLTALGCGGGQRLPDRRLTIATGTHGGVFDVYGRAIVGAINRYLPDLRARARSTHGSVENVDLLKRGLVDAAFVRSDSPTPAIGGGVRIVALARLYDAYLQVIVRKDGGLGRIGELGAGRVGRSGGCRRSRCRVEMGPVASGTKLLADWVLLAAGLQGRVVEHDHNDIAAAAHALEAGQVDAIFWAGGLPTPAITDLATRVAVRFLDLGQVAVALHKRYPDVYTPTRLPRGTYRATTSASTVTVSNYLAVRSDLPDRIAHALTAMLFAHRAELARRHPEAQYLNPTTAIDTFPLRLHPGAERYYRETRP